MCLNLGGVYELHLFDYNNTCNDFSSFVQTLQWITNGKQI